MTLDQLKRRGLTLANRFPLCGLDEVNIEHLSLFYGLGPVNLSLGSHGYYLGASFYGKRSTRWLEKNYNEKGGEKSGGLLLSFLGHLDGKKQSSF